MLRPFNTFFPVVVTPNCKIILLAHNCNFVTVINCNINIQCTGYLVCNIQRSSNAQVENHCSSLYSMPAVSGSIDCSLAIIDLAVNINIQVDINMHNTYHICLSGSELPH